MMVCINKNSVDFQTLKNRSGISEYSLEAICRSYMTKYGRWPYLDELPNSNSEPYLRESLSLNQHNSCDTDQLLSSLNVNTVEEANIKLNQTYKDLEISLSPLNKRTIVNIEHRPSKYGKHEKKPNLFQQDSVNNTVFFNEVLDKLQTLYGINIISTNNSELSKGELSNIIQNAQDTQAFIYNNNIYINTDQASVDAPIHELMHLLFGSIKFTNPDLYYSLISQAENFQGYEMLVKTLKNRTRSDINEELFVTEFSKFVTGQESILSQLDDKIKYEISYNIHRLIDTILMGEYSSSVLGDTIYSRSFRNLAQTLNSSSLNNTSPNLLQQAEVHRILSNYKQELIEKGELKEFC